MSLSILSILLFCPDYHPHKLLPCTLARYVLCVRLRPSRPYVCVCCVCGLQEFNTEIKTQPFVRRVCVWLLMVLDLP